MGLDPSDDCTFWYTTMYNTASTWKTRVASFKFDSCGNGCPFISVTPAALPNGNVGASYNQTVVAVGGTAPYTYAVSTGNLPPGLNLDSNTGNISGTPTTLGTFNFSITATDTNNCLGTQNYSVKIIDCTSLALSPNTLPNGNVETPYNQTVVVSGGTPPYDFTITAGSLPPNLGINSATGQISGTPTTQGTFSFDVTVTDTNDCTVTKSYSITIDSGCLFCDDFEDGILSSIWTYIKLNWIESGGNLQGTPANRKAIAIASPAFSGCLTCTIQTSIQTAGGPSNRIWLLAWYIDKQNTIELLMKEESDAWILKQRSNGAIIKKAKISAVIDPNVAYNIQLGFDGTEFTLTVNGAQLLTMTPAAPVPTGTVGFQSRNTTGSFGFITVN